MWSIKQCTEILDLVSKLNTYAIQGNNCNAWLFKLFTEKNTTLLLWQQKACSCSASQQNVRRQSKPIKLGTKTLIISKQFVNPFFHKHISHTATCAGVPSCTENLSRQTANRYVLRTHCLATLITVKRVFPSSTIQCSFMANSYSWLFKCFEIEYLLWLTTFC